MLEDTVLSQGQATWADDQLLLLERKGFSEECYFTFTYSPIVDRDGTVEGAFCAVIETTERVIGARRLRLLRMLAETSATQAMRRCRLRERYDVTLVADGAQALEELRRELPDLLVSDIMLPRLDGFGLLAAVRSDPATAKLPVMLLSARAGEEARIEGMAAGADDYLVKPFSAAELLVRIEARVQMAALRLGSGRPPSTGVPESATARQVE